MKAYRYYLTNGSFYDQNSDLFKEAGLEEKLIEYDIISETPKGFWVSDKKSKKKRFVLNITTGMSGNRFAYKDKNDAFKSMLIRKSAHLAHLTGHAAKIKKYLKKHRNYLIIPNNTVPL